MFRRYHAVSGNFYEYRFHTTPAVSTGTTPAVSTGTTPAEASSTRNYLQLASIDPARDNFAIRIERRYADQIVTGVFCRIKLSTKEDKSVEGAIIRLSGELDKLWIDLNECDFVFIEKQLPTNTLVVPIAQHAISWFLLRLKDNERRTRLFDVNSKLKNNIILPLKGVTGKALKLLSRDRAREILTARGDTRALSIMDANKSKQDDLADTLCQLEAMLLELNLIGPKDELI